MQPQCNSWSGHFSCCTVAELFAMWWVICTGVSFLHCSFFALHCGLQPVKITIIGNANKTLPKMVEVLVFLGPETYCTDSASHHSACSAITWLDCFSLNSQQAHSLFSPCVILLPCARMRSRVMCLVASVCVCMCMYVYVYVCNVDKKTGCLGSYHRKISR